VDVVLDLVGHRLRVDRVGQRRARERRVVARAGEGRGVQGPRGEVHLRTEDLGTGIEAAFEVVQRVHQVERVASLTQVVGVRGLLETERRCLGLERVLALCGERLEVVYAEVPCLRSDLKETLNEDGSRCKFTIHEAYSRRCDRNFRSLDYFATDNVVLDMNWVIIIIPGSTSQEQIAAHRGSELHVPMCILSLVTQEELDAANIIMFRFLIES